MSDQASRPPRPPEPAPRARNEVRGAAGVASEAVDIVSRPVQGTHDAVSGTVFGVLRRVGLGPVSTPVQVVHDGISTGVYAAVRGIGHLAGRGIGAAAALARPEWRPITGNPSGAVLTGAINGLVGDHMVALDNDLAVPMTLYTATVADSYAEQYGELPRGTEELRAVVCDHPERDLTRLVLFVHGLGETEHAWRLYGEASAGEGYAERVASATGATPLLLRYNTGLPIADNGAALSMVLTDLFHRWPEAVRRLDLVGHSMGGLMLRHACHHAVQTGQPWVGAVRRMIYLGSPHRGAPLAHRVDQLATRLSRWSRSKTWGEFLDRRSAGIRDLVAGVSDTEVPLLAHASHHAVAACVTRSAHGPLAHALGDLLVPVDSAGGAITDVEPLTSSHHFHLLNDPHVHEHLMRWLTAEDDGAGEDDEGGPAREDGAGPP
ncbi:esterase/lipase family protein [Actinomycetospora cinnamomea]|uniref:PGAP1-like protein n=1 Tax=Actinomycetospora cinnamomea TaxID=663609 RepID=A0A2U1EUU6_9PSEU|nr:alpha/beta fold hydrolase [Actinomycetospora cinnamomea]PVZ03692.1 PGAP1-like protein [Actinomycetospora cinnamomea]